VGYVINAEEMDGFEGEYGPFESGLEGAQFLTLLCNYADSGSYINEMDEAEVARFLEQTFVTGARRDQTILNTSSGHDIYFHRVVDPIDWEFTHITPEGPVRRSA
jgi:hypothetical protein